MDNTETIVLVTGGFDPIHAGHILYLQEAARLGDQLIVGINSNQWLFRKKGAAFMSASHRRFVIENMRDVSEVIEFDDTDDSACAAIQMLLNDHPTAHIIFANGGDRSDENVIEMLKFSGHPRVTFKFNVGGSDKLCSSSLLLNEWVASSKDRTRRDWGIYDVLLEMPGVKLKTLHVEPGKSLSMQRHAHRSEHWFVAAGIASLTDGDGETMHWPQESLLTVPAGEWHQLSNQTNEDLMIIEIQFGKYCDESDIERINNSN